MPAPISTAHPAEAVAAVLEGKGARGLERSTGALAQLVDEPGQRATGDGVVGCDDGDGLQPLAQGNDGADDQQGR